MKSKRSRASQRANAGCVAARRNVWRAAGRCVRCRKRSEKNECDECRAYYREYLRKWRAEREKLDDAKTS